MINWKFKEENVLSRRQAEAQKVFTKYPDKIPIIIERIPNADIPDIDKHKYLVPQDLSVAQLIWIIRKRLNIKAEQTLSIYVNKTMIPNSSTILLDLYKQNKDSDGFLYIGYTSENAFGCNIHKFA